VHFALAQAERPTLLVCKVFRGAGGKELSRAEIRRQTVWTGLNMLLEAAAPQLRA
jgi:hypothetical protein